MKRKMCSCWLSVIRIQLHVFIPLTSTSNLYSDHHTCTWSLLLQEGFHSTMKLTTLSLLLFMSSAFTSALPQPTPGNAVSTVSQPTEERIPGYLYVQLNSGITETDYDELRDGMEEAAPGYPIEWSELKERRATKWAELRFDQRYFWTVVDYCRESGWAVGTEWRRSGSAVKLVDGELPPVGVNDLLN